MNEYTDATTDPANVNEAATTPKKTRTVNHAAKCRKAWDAFHDAAVAASEAGVVVTLTYLTGTGDAVDVPADEFTASITAKY